MEHEHTVSSQLKAARLAGMMYLFGTVGSILSEVCAGSPLFAGENAGNIVANETRFRFGIVLSLLQYMSVAVLAWALYILLKSVNRDLARLALFIRVVEVSFFCVLLISYVIIIRLLHNDNVVRAFDTQELQAIARVVFLARADAYIIGYAILSLGSLAFNYLLLRYNYIPKALAALGVFSSFQLFICTLVVIIVPDFLTIAFLYCFAPVLIYEVVLGFWFVFKRIKMPSIAINTQPQRAD